METILLLAATAFIFYRLWSILGSRDGFEKKMDWNVGQNDQQKQEDNIIVLSQDKVEEIYEKSSFDDFDKSISKIKCLEPDFEIEQFLKGAQKAFKLIVTLFAEGKLDKLSHLVSPQIYEKFRQAIDERKSRQEQLEIEFSDIQSELSAIEFEDDKALVTVIFESQQISATINADGLSYDNPSRLVATVRDVWTFKKDLDSRTKIWILSKTKRAS